MRPAAPSLRSGKRLLHALSAHRRLAPQAGSFCFPNAFARPQSGPGLYAPGLQCRPWGASRLRASHLAGSPLRTSRPGGRDAAPGACPAQPLRVLSAPWGAPQPSLPLPRSFRPWQGLTSSPSRATYPAVPPAREHRTGHSTFVSLVLLIKQPVMRVLCPTLVRGTPSPLKKAEMIEC